MNEVKRFCVLVLSISLSLGIGLWHSKWTTLGDERTGGQRTNFTAPLHPEVRWKRPHSTLAPGGEVEETLQHPCTQR